MALPVYANDLTTIATGDLNYDAGTWDESSDAGWDTAGAMVDDENQQYATTSVNTAEAADSCTSAQYTKIGTGSGAAGPGTIMYQHTAAFTVPTDGAVIVHSLWTAPLALNPYAGTFGTAEAGVSVLVGDSFGVFDVFYVSGSDKPPSPEGGWATYAVDPTLTPDGSIGTPTTTTCVGVGIAATAQARGNPQAMQYVRYGRCAQQYTVGDATTPATFAGYAAIDNAAADRFNLLKNIEGGYKAQGLISLGLTGTAVYFKDANVNISFANNLKVSSVFNKIEVHNASSYVYWSAVSIKSLGTVSKGSFSVIDNATVIKKSCTFTDMDFLTYKSNSDISTSTYRRCGLVSQDGAIITSNTFDEPSGAVGLLATVLGNVTKNTFNSDGTGYAVELPTITSDTTLTWDNFESGYVTGVAGNGVGVTPTGNETILVSVDSGVVLTVSVASGASTPSIANSGLGTINVLAGLLPITVTVKDKTDGSFIKDANVMLLRDDTKAQIISGTTNASGVYAESVASSYDGVDFLGWIRQFDFEGYDYETVDVAGTIGSSGVDLSVLLDRKLGEYIGFSMYFTGVEDIIDTNVHQITMTFSKEPKSSTMILANITQQVEDNGTVSDLAVTANPKVWTFNFQADASVEDLTNHFNVSTSVTDLDDDPISSTNSVEFEIVTVPISVVFSDVADITDTDAHTITMTFNKPPKASTMIGANISQQVEDNGTISDIGVTANNKVWEFDYAADADITDTTNFYRASIGITDENDVAIIQTDSANFTINNTGIEGQTYNTEVVVDNTKVSGSIALVDFPLSLTETSFSTNASSLFSNCRSDGGDLRFYSDSAGTTQIPHEIASIDTGTSKIEVYIKVPSVATGVDTSVWVRYGDSTLTMEAVDSIYGRNAVWSGFDRVYHFNDDPYGTDGTDGTLTDSSGILDGTTIGTWDTTGDLVDGTFKKGWQFNGVNQGVNIGNHASFPLNMYIDSSVTSLFKYNDSGNSEMLAGKFDVANFADCCLMHIINTDDTVESRMGNVFTSGTNTLIDTNHYMASSRSKTDGTFYTSFDDTIDSQTQDTGMTTVVDATIGTGWADETMVATNREFSGIISEVRITLDTFFSDDWVKTERNNLINPSTFATAQTPVPL